MSKGSDNFVYHYTDEDSRLKIVDSGVIIASKDDGMLIIKF
jgi:hypothetical protein